MAIAMVAMLAFGGTYAYFTSATTESLSGDIHTATVNLTKDGTALTLSGHVKELLPSETVTTTATFNDGSTRGTWVLFKIDDEALVEAAFTVSAMKVDGVALEETTDGSGVFYYENSQASDDEQIGDVVKKDTISVVVEILFKADAGNTYQDQTYSVTISACSIQHQGFANAEAARAQSAFKD